jgi:tellurite resistance protein/uncharacterized protein (DUF697 family)
MNQSDFETIVTIAALAALANGQQDDAERARLATMVGRLGLPTLEQAMQRVQAGQLKVQDLARQLSDDNARQLAFNTATAVCNADGVADDAEQKFLAELRDALGLQPAAVKATEDNARALASAPVAPAVEVQSGTPPSDAGLDDLILKQAIITGALEILPDHLANVAILPLQLRLVYQIGQRYGQQLDINQIKDLAGTLGIGAAAQVMEGAVRKVLGGVVGGLLGGLLGGATGMAAGAAVTFASTYALGHVAKQYYTQGRRLSADDLRSLFARFEDEAKALFPKVQGQIQAQSRNLNLQSVLSSIRGT